MDSFLKHLAELLRSNPATHWVRVLALLFVSLFAPAGAVDFALPVDLPAVPGQQVEVTVQAANAQGVSGFRLVVNFDSDKVSYVPGSASVDGTIAAGFLMPEANTSVPGRLVISSAGVSDVSAAAGSLLRFRLLPSESAPIGASIPLVFDPTLTRANDGALAVTLSNGNLLTERSTTLRLSSLALVDPATQEATVSVSADSLIGVQAFDLVIESDVDAVALVDGSATAIPGSFGAVTVTPLTAGRWRFQAQAPSPLTAGDGPLLTFRLRLLESSAVDRIIAVKFVAASSSINNGAIAVALVNGSIDARRIVSVVLPTNVNAEPGDVVEMTFSLDDYRGLQGFRFVINFPSSQLSYVTGSAQAEPFFREDFNVLAVNSTPGRLVISGASQLPMAGGTGSLLRIRVRVAQTVPYNTLIPLNIDRTLSRLNDGALAADYTDGSILVQRVVILSIPSEIPGSPGAEVEVRVSIDQGRGVEGFRISTLWPAAQASYVDRSATNAGTLSEEFVALITNANTAGRVVVSSSGEEPLGVGGGTLLRYRLRIPTSAGTEGLIPLTLDPALTRVNDGQYRVQLVSGSIRLGPADVSFPETDCLLAGPVILGTYPVVDSADVNMDAVIDAADLIFCAARQLPTTIGDDGFIDTELRGACLQTLLSLLSDAPADRASDTNGDGIIDAADLIFCRP